MKQKSSQTDFAFPAGNALWFARQSTNLYGKNVTQKYARENTFAKADVKYVITDVKKLIYGSDYSGDGD